MMARTTTSAVVDDTVLSAYPSPQELREEIEQLAYEFYCQCGYEHGHDLEHWLEAERRGLERYPRGHITNG